MSRRAHLPGAAELFRSTGAAEAAQPAERQRPGTAPAAQGKNAGTHGRSSAGRRGSGRQRHDTKITVYVSDDELLALEHARLNLRGTHGLSVDRGRVVREAVAVLLADFEERGAESLLVRRLRQEPDQ